MYLINFVKNKKCPIKWMLKAKNLHFSEYCHSTEIQFIFFCTKFNYFSKYCRCIPGLWILDNIHKINHIARQSVNNDVIILNTRFQKIFDNFTSSYIMLSKICKLHISFHCSSLIKNELETVKWRKSVDLIIFCLT